ncbi:MAG: hypothetical protein AAGJ87_08025, partial [Pseudomonadota bacterium]
ISSFVISASAEPAWQTQHLLPDFHSEDTSVGDLNGDVVLLINAASFDTAQRFVFSNIAVDAELISEAGDPLLDASGFSLGTCARATPADVPLSLAVASSAAFPPAFGPVAIEVAPACGEQDARYWHLGDGGILDNSGVETLQEVLVERAAGANPPARATIFEFDAGNAKTAEEFTAIRNLKLWTSGPARVHHIAAERADALRKKAWRAQEKTLGFPVTIVSLKLSEAALEGAAWPASCGQGVRKKGTPQDRLNKVPTSFRITPCDADLVELAAKTLVERAMTDGLLTALE